MRWLSRFAAVLTGIALVIGGLNLSADVGDILWAVPMLILGGLHLLAGIAPRRRRGLRFTLVTAGALVLAGMNFVGDYGGSVFAGPMLLLGGLQLLIAAVSHFRGSTAAPGRVIPRHGRWS